MRFASEANSFPYSDSSDKEILFNSSYDEGSGMKAFIKAKGRIFTAKAKQSLLALVKNREFWSVFIPWLIIAVSISICFSVKGGEWFKQITFDLFDWMNSLPLFPHVTFLLGAPFIPSTIFSIPGIGIALQLYGGYRFNKDLSFWPIGGLITAVALLLASLMCFFLGRYVTNAKSCQVSAKQAQLLPHAVARPESAIPSVILLRVSPVLPYTLVSYLLGRVATLSLPRYLIGTFIGLLPSNLLVAYFGSVATKIVELLDEPNEAGKTAIATNISIAAVALTVFAVTGLLAQRYLNRQHVEDAKEDEQQNEEEMSILSESDEFKDYDEEESLNDSIVDLDTEDSVGLPR